MGTPYCINGHGAITASSVEQIVDQVLELPERQRLQILAPIIRKKKGQHKNIIEKVQKDGYVRVRVDGEIYDVTEVPELSKSQQHTIEVVVDGLSSKMAFGPVSLIRSKRPFGSQMATWSSIPWTKTNCSFQSTMLARFVALPSLSWNRVSFHLMLPLALVQIVMGWVLS